MQPFNLLNVLELNPAILIVFGLIGEVVGALIISLDALGVNKFVLKLDSESEPEKRKAEIFFISFTNKIIVFLGFCLIFFFVLKILGVNTLASLILLPLGYFFYRLIYSVFKTISKTVYAIRPATKRRRARRPGGSVIGATFKVLIAISNLIITLFWACIYAVFYFISEILINIIDIFLRAINQVFLVPLFVKSIRFFDRKLIENSGHGIIKKHVAIGGLFLFFGFVYQIIGTVWLFEFLIN